MRPNMRPTEKTDLKGALNDLSAYMRKSLGVVRHAPRAQALAHLGAAAGDDGGGEQSGGQDRQEPSYLHRPSSFSSITTVLRIASR